MNRSDKQITPIEERVLDFFRQNHLVEQTGLLVIAVSGGPDSVCLLHVLLSLKKQLHIELHIAHLNHQLRGVASIADAKYVTRLANILGTPSTIGECDVKSYRSKYHLTLEEAAREVRYGFLQEVIKSTSAFAVAVGHTLDDNVETILMHVIRGTGTRGLRGLQAVSEWSSLIKPSGSITVLRPLLDVTRKETADYCHEHNLVPRVDRTNFSLSLLRNRVRLKLLPELRTYNPRIDQALLRTARIAGDEYDLLKKECARLWRTMAEERDNAIILNKRKLFKESPALQRYLLRMALERMIGNLKDIETQHIEEILQSLKKRSGSVITLPGDLIFAVEYDRYVLARDPADLCPFPVLTEEYRFRVPGEISIAGWHVTGTISSHDIYSNREDEKRSYLPFHHLLPGNPESDEPLRNAGALDPEGIQLSAVFDFETTGNRLSIRPLKPGDRFQPLGLGKVKKVGRFMVDARIPHWWRDRIPIVSSQKHIIWVAGWRTDERTKISEKTRELLFLKFRKASDKHVCS
jgi:tRNA(Ile)-lysidine synthase